MFRLIAIPVVFATEDGQVSQLQVAPLKEEGPDRDLQSLDSRYCSQTMANGYTCESRANWLMANRGRSAQEAMCDICGEQDECLCFCERNNCNSYRPQPQPSPAGRGSCNPDWSCQGSYSCRARYQYCQNSGMCSMAALPQIQNDCPSECGGCTDADFGSSPAPAPQPTPWRPAPRPAPQRTPYVSPWGSLCRNYGSRVTGGNSGSSRCQYMQYNECYRSMPECEWWDSCAGTVVNGIGCGQRVYCLEFANCDGRTRRLSKEAAKSIVCNQFGGRSRCGCFCDTFNGAGDAEESSGAGSIGVAAIFLIVSSFF